MFFQPRGLCAVRLTRTLGRTCSLVIGLIAAIVIAGLLTANAANSSSASKGVRVTSPASTNATQPSFHPAPADLATERITITPSGLNPEEINLAAGQVRLVIDNTSGLEEVSLRLDRENGPRLLDLRISRNKLNWRGTVELAPGRYVLTEANHPGWVCIFNITE